MDTLTLVRLLCCLVCSVQGVQSVGFHLPDPVTFAHSCTPLGSWSVAGNVTLTEDDLEFYSSNLTLRLDGRNLCNLDLTSCPELATTSSSSSSAARNSLDVCECVSRFSEDDYSIYIRQGISPADVGAMLTIIVPGQEKYGRLQATYDIGRIAGKLNSSISYQINSGHPSQLGSTQNITTCGGQPLVITVCMPNARSGTVLKMTELWQTISSPADHCIHIIEKFSFIDNTDAYPVVFSYDEGAGCPFQEKFTFNVYEKKNGCMAAATTTSNPAATLPSTSPTAPCPETATSPARQTVTLSNGIKALCDSWTNGGNWVVIQRRAKGDVDFYRGWADYVAGFGDLDGDHWMGLQDIHTLCPPSKPCTLRIDLRDDQLFKFGTHSQTHWVEYSAFSLGGYTEKYRLSVAGYNTSSTVGDGLTSYHHGIPFTNYDRDNDLRDDLNCAHYYRGGWWYKGCHAVNLNGKWGERNTLGLRWYGGINMGNQTIFATYTEMKVRIHA